jgi:hypothetical protein
MYEWSCEPFSPHGASIKRARVLAVKSTHAKFTLTCTWGHNKSATQAVAESIQVMISLNVNPVNLNCGKAEWYNNLVIFTSTITAAGAPTSSPS